MGGFEDAVTIADVGAGGDTEAAHLRGAGIAEVIAIEIWSGEDAVFVGAQKHLLENGIGDAIVDHELLFPVAFAVGGADGVEHLFDFGVDGFLEIFGGGV